MTSSSRELSPPGLRNPGPSRAQTLQEGNGLCHNLASPPTDHLDVDSNLPDQVFERLIKEKFSPFWIVSPAAGGSFPSLILTYQYIISRIIPQPRSRPRDENSFVLEIETLQQQKSMLSIGIANGVDLLYTRHPTLNISKGRIYSKDLAREKTEDIAELLCAKNVLKVERLPLPNVDLSSSPLFLLTFDQPALPETITIAWFKFKVRPQIPLPRRCFNCQKYGHTSIKCRSPVPTCNNCSTFGHSDDNCLLPTRCKNCSGPHKASDRLCPAYAFEKEVLNIHYTDQVDFAEARRRASTLRPLSPSFDTFEYELGDFEGEFAMPGLDQSTIEDYIFEHTYNKDDQTCAICSNCLKAERCASLACFHVFHKNCITTWLADCASCPICRTHPIQGTLET